MRIRHLYQRTRAFRRTGFILMSGLCLLLALADTQRSLWQLLLGGGFCAVWPWITDAIHAAAARDPGVFDQCFYALECALVALVFTWLSLPPLPGFAALLCLLAGAVALAGPRLLLAGALAVALGGAVGARLAPQLDTASAPAVDFLAMVLVLGFTLALAHMSFRQAQRLDRHRRELAVRSAELERLNERMQRYLPPSLCERLARAPEALCRWERRWLTVVFVDLVGFTELAERIQAEPLARLLDEYLTAMIRAAEGRGGEVSKLLGDGVLVVFGNSADANRHQCAAAAATFCKDLPALLDRLSLIWRGRGEPVALQTRAGVASGFCTLGDRGGAGRLDFTLVGSPVNLASRLQACAGVGGVLLDAASAALAEGAHDLAAPRRLTVKGFGDMMVHALAPAASQVDPGSASAIVPDPASPSPLAQASAPPAI